MGQHKEHDGVKTDT